MALPKVGLLELRARPYLGDLWVADISVPPIVYEMLGLQVGRLFTTGDILALSWT